MVIVLLLSARGGDADEPEVQPPATGVAATTVELTIDFGNGFRKSYPAIPAADRITVADAMQFAAEHAHATRFTTRGQQQTAFLSAIDGIENEGYGKRCWIFYVNGKKADESYGVAKLVAGDTILWRFETFP